MKFRLIAEVEILGGPTGVQDIEVAPKKQGHFFVYTGKVKSFVAKPF
jgi:hypothetical protein